jgi:hypothetical protein
MLSHTMPRASHRELWDGRFARANARSWSSPGFSHPSRRSMGSAGGGRVGAPLLPGSTPLALLPAESCGSTALPPPAPLMGTAASRPAPWDSAPPKCGCSAVVMMAAMIAACCLVYSSASSLARAAPPAPMRTSFRGRAPPRGRRRPSACDTSTTSSSASSPPLSRGRGAWGGAAPLLLPLSLSLPSNTITSWAAGRGWELAGTPCWPARGRPGAALPATACADARKQIELAGLAPGSCLPGVVGPLGGEVGSPSLGSWDPAAVLPPAARPGPDLGDDLPSHPEESESLEMGPNKASRISLGDAVGGMR